MEIKKRRDHWLKEEDERLAEIVLHNVRNRKTQLEAFELAAKELGRTKQACGFRWNKVLRGQFGQSLTAVRNQSKQSVLNCSKLAKSFDELTEDYLSLELQYRELQNKHEKLVEWLQQGNSLIKG